MPTVTLKGKSTSPRCDEARDRMWGTVIELEMGLAAPRKHETGGIQLAASSKTESVEGNHYFPRADLVESLFKPSAAGTQTMCGWKGMASYLDVHLADGTVVKDAAWYYPQAKSGAKNIEGYVAFYKNKVQVAN